MTTTPPLDEQDKAILRLLQADSSISNVELAQRVKLSPPTIHARIKRLEQLGFIRRYAALLDSEKLGFDVHCFIQISLQVHQPEEVAQFRASVAQMPEVLECHHVLGQYDYLLKVVVRNRKELQQFLMDKLTPIKAVARIHTNLALTEIKSTTILPIE